MLSAEAARSSNEGVLARHLGLCLALTCLGAELPFCHYFVGGESPPCVSSLLEFANRYVLAPGQQLSSCVRTDACGDLRVRMHVGMASANYCLHMIGGTNVVLNRQPRSDGVRLFGRQMPRRFESRDLRIEASLCPMRGRVRSTHCFDGTLQMHRH